MSLSFLNRLALILLFGLVASSQAVAAWDDTAYAKVAKMALTLNKVDPQKIYTVVYRVKPGTGHTHLPQNLKFQVWASGRTIPLPVQPDGRIDLPARQDWADNEALVQTNAPQGRIVFAVSLESRTPPGTRMSYAKLAESVPVMERGIKEIAGMMSFMAPKVKQLSLSFERPGPQTVTLILIDGKRKIWKSVANGQLTLPWEPRWLGATVELSSPLRGVDRILK